MPLPSSGVRAVGFDGTNDLPSGTHGPSGWKTPPVLRRRKGFQPAPDLPQDADLPDDSGDHLDDDLDVDRDEDVVTDGVDIDPVGEADDKAGASDGGDDIDLDSDMDVDSQDAADDGDAEDSAVALARPPVEKLTDARLLFDCSGWDRDDRAELDAALGQRSIDRVWQGPELVVGMLDEHLVEEAFDDMGVGQAHLSGSAAQVVYEVGEWPRVLRDSLAESLLVAGIACGWDDAADLHVSAVDEVAVDAIVEAMPDPDEVFEEAEGTEVQDLLTQLYAAVDRLKDNPKIPGARLDVVEAADRMDRLAVPFGFDANQWRDLVERAVDLRDEIDDDVASAQALENLDPDDLAADDEDTADLTSGESDDADSELDGAEAEAAESGGGSGGVGHAELGPDSNREGGTAGQASDAPARLPFAARAAQLRDRLVRLV